MSPIIDLQRRFAEVGRIRAGAKGTKGQPQKLDAWRLTSANHIALTSAADIYGGTVREWDNAPTPGQFELFTESRTLDIMVPPTHEPYSLWYESWTGGGCEHRCDGTRDHLNDKPCSCNPDKRNCKPTLRVSLALHRIPGLGVWRYESHGYYAATELPATLDLLSNASTHGKYLTGFLRLEERVTKTKANGTRRFLVPVLDLQQTIGELAGISPTSSPSQLAAPAGNELATSSPAGALPTAELASDDAKRVIWNAAQAGGLTVDDLQALLSSLRGEDEAELASLLASEVDGLLAAVESEVVL
jgi:hypothetical protein